MEVISRCTDHPWTMLECCLLRGSWWGGWGRGFRPRDIFIGSSRERDLRSPSDSSIRRTSCLPLSGCRLELCHVLLRLFLHSPDRRSIGYSLEISGECGPRLDALHHQSKSD